MSTRSKARHHSTATQEELAEWDAEIEADYRQVRTETNQVRKRQIVGVPLRDRHIGSPLGFLIDVAIRTRGRDAVLVALCVYRRTIVTSSRIVTLDKSKLDALDIGRGSSNRALENLSKAGLVRLQHDRNRKTVVEFLWRPSNSSTATHK